MLVTTVHLERKIKKNHFIGSLITNMLHVNEDVGVKEESMLIYTDKKCFATLCILCIQ